ncbi:MAG: OmpH family outer membrane protein, partial [Flavobacteriales bacterium]
ILIVGIVGINALDTLKKNMNNIVDVSANKVQLGDKIQQDLLKIDEKQNRDLMLLQQEEMSNYYSKLQGFCQSFAKSLGFDYIMVYQNGGAFLYSNPDYDVSNYVIDAINKEYSQNKTLTNSPK